LSREAKKT